MISNYLLLDLAANVWIRILLRLNNDNQLSPKIGLKFYI
jgi:hypothetical protein